MSEVASLSLQMRCNSTFMNSRVSSSSAPKGSSRSRIAGWVTSIRQMATRCAMPPESSKG